MGRGLLYKISVCGRGNHARKPLAVILEAMDTSQTEALEAALISVFNEAQNGKQFHNRQLTLLSQTFEEWSSSLNDFFETFFGLVQRILIVLKREPATERLVEFIARFAVSTIPKRSRTDEIEDESSSEEETEEDKIFDNFAHLLLMRLMGFNEARDKAVRFRVAQMVAKILSYARDDPAVKINSSILDDVSETLLALLYDRYPSVRTQAALGLSFFQDPNDPDCQITNALAWSMENDSSAEVRRCIVLNLVLTGLTLNLVIGRTRDVSDVVRRSAFIILSEKCTIRHLKIKQRLRLLRDGLQDRNTQVKEACVRNLLRSWCITLDGDVHDLLRRLDLESSTDVCEMVLVNLFEDIQNEELVKSFQNLLNIGDNGGQTMKEESQAEQEMEQDTATPNVCLFVCFFVSLLLFIETVLTLDC